MKKNKKKIPLPEFDIYDTLEEYEDMGPVGILDFMDEQLRRAVVYLKKAGRSNADLEYILIHYGRYSRAMNIHLRKIMARDDCPYSWKVAYSYWWNRTHHLETYRKSFFSAMGDRKQIDQGQKMIRKIVIEGMDPEQVQALSNDFAALIERLSSKEELKEDEIKDVLAGKEVTKNYDK